MKKYLNIGLLGFIFLGASVSHGLAQQRTLYFPQLAFGASPDGYVYRSTVLIFNLNEQAVPATLEFFDDTGRRTDLALMDNDGNRLGPANTFNLSIGPQRVRRYVTETTGNLVVGWARLSAAQDLKGSLIVQILDRGGKVISEAGVPSSPVLRVFTIFHDNLGPDTATGLALVNPSATDGALLTLRMFNLNGAPIGSVKTIPLAPLNHMARFLTDPLLFPEAARTEGFLVVSSSADLVALTLRVDGIQLTTVPVIPGGREIPAINQLTPNQGPVGTTVTIDGQNFSATPSANSVRFGGTPAVVALASPTQLITSVPSGATSGPVTVTVNTQSSNEVNFTVTSATLNPVIAAISPARVRPGIDDFDLVINGSNFLPISTIRVGGAFIATTVVNTVQLRGRVTRDLVATPAQVPVAVVNKVTPFGGPESNTVILQVTQEGLTPPQIIALDPNSGPAGSRVYIRGANFESTAPNNLVKFSGVPALVRSASPTQLEVVVPYGISSGPVTVAVRGTPSNRMPFTIQPLPDLVQIPVGLNPQAVAFNPINQTAIVAATRGDRISIIDLASNSVIAELPPGGSAPTGVDVDPNLNVALVANRLGSTKVLGVIDLNANTALPSINLLRPLDQPFDVAINPNTDLAVISDRLGSVTFYDLGSGTEVGSIRVANPDHIAIHPGSNRAYVTDFSNGALSIIDLATQTLVGTIPVGTLPFGVAVNPNTNIALVANYGSNTVTVVDLAMGRARNVIPVGTQPFRIAINPNTNMAVVTNLFDNTISIIDLNTERVIETRPTGGNGPQGVAINPVNNTAIVGNGNSNNVSIMRLP